MLFYKSVEKDLFTWLLKFECPREYRRHMAWLLRYGLKHKTIQENVSLIVGIDLIGWFLTPYKQYFSTFIALRWSVPLISDVIFFNFLRYAWQQ